ncbi:hypothetical protein AVEN_117399-1 [Araneus ventricosus]|uniref:Uncharacterized protein n=1 Tax=Araneus ventricosus TaxID=182803 RepID=A0A4Y2E422_ARAVE|nr:hypothetical protein AVEN_117399-1 [Araneus ventricosus]
MHNTQSCQHTVDNALVMSRTVSNGRLMVPLSIQQRVQCYPGLLSRHSSHSINSDDMDSQSLNLATTSAIFRCIAAAICFLLNAINVPLRQL